MVAFRLNAPIIRPRLGIPTYSDGFSQTRNVFSRHHPNFLARNLRVATTLGRIPGVTFSDVD